jgi:integrase
MDAEGCTCNPSFYIVADGGKTQELLATKNKKEARAALNRVNVTVHETGEWEPPKKITFEAWWDEWFEGLRRPRQSTKRSYTSTGDYCKHAFGHTVVRQVGTTHIQRLMDEMGEAKLSGSTMAKHLRVLSACFRAAIARGYATRNPVATLSAAEKPRARVKEAAYFTNDDLPKLVASLPAGLERALVLVALKTGLRLGELRELRWSDVDLLASVLRVRRGYVQGVGAEGTKSHQARTVDLTDEVGKLLAAWWAESGKPGGTSSCSQAPAQAATSTRRRSRSGSSTRP